MNDAQTWAVIGIFAAIYTGQFVELRSDRKEFRAAFGRVDERFDRIDERFVRMDERIDTRFREVEGRLASIE